MPRKPSTDYASHDVLTDPWPHGALFDALPVDVAELSRVIQGLLIHDFYGFRLYGPTPARFLPASRETLPVSKRIDAILAAGNDAISDIRPPAQRSVSTCRDFALMLCSMLRQHGVPARVRCGFAKYFHPPSYEDHWICEVWRPERRRWAKADAQLDDAHRSHLRIDFDVTDIPDDQFLCAWQAWRLCQSHAGDPALFGHGETTGAWFIQVNLARDLLSLNKCEVSPWDGWRDPEAQHRILDEETISLCDRLAALAEAADGLAPPEPGDDRLRDFLSLPPWQR